MQRQAVCHEPLVLSQTDVGPRMTTALWLGPKTLGSALGCP